MKLAPVIQQYIDLKQAMGSRFHTEAVILTAFCHALGDIAIGEVQAEQVTAYLAGTGPVTRFWHRKYDALRGFYRFAVGRGSVACSPLPPTVPKPPVVFTPYIYSTAELKRLLDTLEDFPLPRAPLSRTTLRVVLLLLYGAALRISEALALTLADVDVCDRVLTIRTSKFYKTRLVPIGPRLAHELLQYVNARGREAPAPPSVTALFLTRTGHMVTRGQVERAFRRLCGRAGIRRDDDARYQPRLHDLRHAAAVHRLVAWYQEGADVQRLLPNLATYLGHVNVAATQRYLTMTPELLQAASRRFEQYAQPEVTHD